MEDIPNDLKTKSAMVHQHRRQAPPKPADVPQFFDYITEGPEHLIAGFEPNDLWRQPPGTPASIEFGFSADQQSVNVYPLPTTYPASSSLTISGGGPLGAALSPASDTPYSSSSSPTISAPLNIGVYNTSQQDSPNLYSASGVPASPLHGYDYYSSVGFGLGTPESLVVPSPVVTEINLTDRELAPYDNEFAPGADEASMVGSSSGRSRRMSRNKRVRTGAEQDVSSAWSAPPSTPRSLMAAGPVPASRNAATAAAASKSKSKLRSASRSSKNVANKPDETCEERRTRNAHNIVEKQYRNRLNARFEALLNVLPPSLRSPGTGDGETEVRLSKGDVLDMSTTYIRTLENQCSRLEREREELTSNIDRLTTILTNDGRPKRDGFPGEGS